jgi:DNA-binding beta-propeller fold protein YncE
MLKYTQFLMPLAAIAALAPVSGSATAAPAYQVEARIAGPDGGWDFATVDPVRGRLYVARSDAIMAVDLATGMVTPQLVSASRAHQVLALADGREVLETDGTTGLVRFVDADSGALLGQVKVGPKPDAAFLDPATGLVVVMSGGDGTVALIDPVRRSLVATIAVGGVLEVGAADGRGKAWVNVEDRNTLVEIDLRSHRVIGQIALTGCDGPTGLALVAGGQRMISACANGVAVITDPKARKVVGTIAIGKDPDGVLYDAKRGLAFIPCGGSGVLEILSATRPDAIAKVGQVVTQISAKTAALDPRTGKIYLPSARLLPPEAGAKRGKPEPGSFAIIVVAPAATPTSGSPS